MKKCIECSVTKPRSEFYKAVRNADKLSGYCKPCKIEIDYWRKIVRVYGVSREEYEEQLVRQEGVCQICKEECPKGRLVVDHCHQSGDFRGLLCRNCNLALGNFKDNPELMEQGAQYVRRTTKEKNR